MAEGTDLLERSVGVGPLEPGTYAIEVETNITQAAIAELQAQLKARFPDYRFLILAGAHLVGAPLEGNE